MLTWQNVKVNWKDIKGMVLGFCDDLSMTFDFLFQDWIKPKTGTSNSVYLDHEKFNVEKLWDNKLGRTKEEFDNGTCFHSKEYTYNHKLELDLAGEYDITAISILNRSDFRR